MIDDSWSGKRARFRELRSEIEHLDSPDRNIDAELARLLIAGSITETDGDYSFEDGSPLPPYTASRREAAILWFQCLHDEPVPPGDAIAICRQLVEESIELF